MIKNEISLLPISYLKNAASREAESTIKSAAIFAVGEFHGVRENAELYLKILKKFEFKTIALEYPQSLRSSLEDFLKEQGDAPISSSSKLPKHYSLEKLTDGRVNLEYLEFLRQAINECGVKKLIFFDNESNTISWNERDEKYAKEFLKDYDPEAKTLLIAGGYHTKLDPFESEHEEGTLVPMLHLLKKKIDKISVCEIRYNSGEFYNFGIKKFSEKNIREKENFWEIDKSGKIIFNIIKAHSISEI